MTVPMALLLLSITASQPIAGENLDSLLDVQRQRSGAYANHVFLPFDKFPLEPEDRLDLRFLLAYLPLSDLAQDYVTAFAGNELLRNVRLAREARRMFDWGDLIPEEIYLHFVLPHRVSQEPFVPGWREQFLKELAPRVQGLTMSQAALEVNHWCHEKATFKVSSGRDQDPLTTVRAGLGRCEEEMILAICALRAVSVPARQCYTPYWAHCDNNHAWVEVWADGRWHHLGACEPKPQLSDAWFTSTVRRAMLVVSTAYGNYHGHEPVLRRYGRSTALNSTPVYGDVKQLEVQLIDRKRRPAREHRIIFSLLNYGALMPALALSTDGDGRCELLCGLGDWFISAGNERCSVLRQVTAGERGVVLPLEKYEKMPKPAQFDYNPPPEPEAVEFPPPDSLFQLRLAMEDSIRERNLWRQWGCDAGFESCDSFHSGPPDSIRAGFIAALASADTGSVLKLLEDARGNWGTLYRFATGSYPVVISHTTELPYITDPSGDDIEARWMLLETLTEKDRRDFQAAVLDDHFRNSTLDLPLSSPDTRRAIEGMDEESKSRYRDCVIAPRLDYEPSTAWRGELCGFLRSHDALFSSRQDRRLARWLGDSITVEEDPDRLGAPLTPAQTLKLRRGSRRDAERLYAALCRVRGIPARFDPVTERLQRFDMDRWVDVILFPEKSGRRRAPKAGFLTVEADTSDSLAQGAEYLKDWAVQRWMADHFGPVDFGYQKPFREIEWPRELPPGSYCLTTGLRRQDGSAPVALFWFRIKPEKQTALRTEFRPWVAGDGVSPDPDAGPGR